MDNVSEKEKIVSSNNVAFRSSILVPGLVLASAQFKAELTNFTSSKWDKPFIFKDDSTHRKVFYTSYIQKLLNIHFCYEINIKM